jgi:replicative DNA helicase
LDRTDALRLVAERTGYSFEDLSEVAESREKTRANEDRERELHRLAEEVNRGLAEGKDSVGIARDLAGRLARLTTSAVDEPPAFNVDRLFRETRNMPPGRTSGWAALDAIGVAFYPGELSVVGARTGHCKTSFLVGLLANWLRQADAEDVDELFVLYSSEEPEVRIFHRLLSLLTSGSSGWSANEIRDYFRAGLESRGESYEWPETGELERAKERLASWEDRLLVVHRPRWDVDTIAAHARGLAERRTIGGVFVDYLQRIPAPAGSYDRRDIEVSLVARSMKALAVELAVPVVTGAQINREAAGLVDRTKIQGTAYKEATGEIRKGRPELHHLREGGSEQEADSILGLLNYRADFATDAKTSAPATTLVEVGTLKARYGDVGRWAGLAFDGRFHLLRDPEDYEKEELALERAKLRTKKTKAT